MTRGSCVLTFVRMAKTFRYTPSAHCNTKLIFCCPNILGHINESPIRTGTGACPYDERLAQCTDPSMNG